MPDGSLADRLAAEIAGRGPLPFSRFMEVALYDAEAGFYGGGTGRAGRRRGDFITSPEVGPLFGAVVAAALDRWWDELGRPDPYRVVEAGAGPGTLARAVLAAAPRCLPALRLTLVERSLAQRDLHPDRDVVDSRETLPAPTGAPAVVFANELLDNLPFDLAERSASGERWNEVRVGVAGTDLVEVTVPLDPVAATLLDDLAPAARPGARAPVQRAAGEWLGEAGAVAGPGGRVVVIDYAATTAALVARPWTEWLRTYRAHGRGGHPLEAPGSQDITCEVAVDQLAADQFAAVGPPDHDRAQAEWLRLHGIDHLVAQGKAVWAERGHIGDLAAVRARSRVSEAEALTDPAGLGGFRVLEWTT
jgi:SAM-dependent MidA family methyltransferase